MTAATQAPAATTPEERESFRLLGSAVMMAIVLGLMLLGGYHLVLRHLRHSPEARIADHFLTHSPQLKRVLGDPFAYRLEAGELDPEGMKATFSYSVEGKFGDASIDLEMVKQGNDWHLDSGTIETDDGVIPLELH